MTVPGHRHQLPRLALLLLVATLAALGCRDATQDGRGEAAPPAAGVTDAAGREFGLDASPRRIISLVPSATEVLLALDVGERLVGRTDFDTASALAPLPSVGGGLGPSLEVIVSLRPDLVIRFAGEADRRTPSRLDELGIAHFAVQPDRLEDARAIIADLGRLTGRNSVADSILAEIDGRLERVAASVAGAAPVATAFLMDGTPPWAAGPGSFIGELITLAGGQNVFSDLDRRYAPVSAEEVVARGLDVVLTPMGARPGGVPAGVRLVEVSALTQLPGPRLGEAAEEIARALHPELLR